MNTIWSEHVQGIGTLYLSRKLRFDDCFYEQYEDAFQLDPHAKLRILEIGCGPGALAEALHRWYPNAEITAMDRDSAFVQWGREHIDGVTFVEGDATAIPFSDGTFDVVISNTVQEHIEPLAFWKEQKRILKKNGICLCLSARKGIYSVADCLKATQEETDFWNRCPDWREENKAYQVCRYPMTEAQLPASMEQNGFSNVSTGYAVIDLTPDAPKYSKDMAEAMIEAMRASDLEAVRQHPIEGYSDILQIINDKYDRRLFLYRNGEKQWDTSVSVTMIVRGVAE